MAEIYQKSCYTTRSSGYKYRTLSTNTGDKKRRDSKEDSTFDRKFKELQQEIAWRINKQVTSAQQSRETIKEKMEMIDTKIDSILELQNTVTSLKKNLQDAEISIADLSQKIDMIDGASLNSFALRSQKSSFRTHTMIEEDEEIFNVTDV